jgi:AraC family transcriptional regulator
LGLKNQWSSGGEISDMSLDTSADLNHRALSADDFLSDPVESDEVSVLKVGGSADPHSMLALYRSEGRDEGSTSVNPQLDGFLLTVILEDMEGFPLYRNGKRLDVPSCGRGTIGLHDLRNSWTAPAFSCYSANLVISAPYLRQLQTHGRYQGMDLLTESLSYQDRDETLLHIALALQPILRQPSWGSRLFVDQLFLATSAYLTMKCRGHEAFAAARGGLTLRQERIAKEYFAANLGGNVSLEDVSRLCDLSPPYFARLFKKSTGTSPYKWYLDQRLTLAKSLLTTTDDELTKIALECGFADQSHFTRTFSRVVGISPGVWRRQKTN